MSVLRNPETKTYHIEPNPDGSVTFTAKEYEQMTDAVDSIFHILNRMPTYVGDFYDDHADYIEVRKWIDMLIYGEYNPREYIEEYEDEEAVEV